MIKERVSVRLGFHNGIRCDCATGSTLILHHDLLAKHSSGLIALSACLSGAVAEPLIEGRFDDARDAAYRLRDIFGKSNFFLEVQDQGLEIDGPVNRDLVRLSRESAAYTISLTKSCPLR